VVTISKLNPTQLESIKQILTLRYSTNLETSSQKLVPEDFETKQIINPEIFWKAKIRWIGKMKSPIFFNFFIKKPLFKGVMNKWGINTTYHNL